MFAFRARMTWTRVAEPTAFSVSRCLAALILVLTVAACTRSTVSVPHDAGELTLQAGDTLEVEFGQVNPSIGDSWHLVQRPDDAVLKDLGEELDTDRAGGVGAGGDLTWRFEAAGTGRAVISFQYCYRSGPPDCEGDDEPAPKPTRLAVTVR